MTKITCVVDNKAQKDTSLQSEHGLSFWIETAQGNIIFDTGQTNAVFAHNLSLLRLNPKEAVALALSHAHYDHTGGLDTALSQNAVLKIYAHSDIFQPRYSLRDGEYRSIGAKLTRQDLEGRAQLTLSAAPQKIIPNLWTTGEIIERPEPEGRSAHHFIRAETGWQPDPYRDDLSLVLKTKAGIILICGCCHAGLLNTLFHVEKHFEGPIIAVLGGTHLTSLSDTELGHVISVLRDRYMPLDLYINHCTGERAYQALADTFGHHVKPCPAGTVLQFAD
jgi:7,8-dihydropterin-6-yl-methyl-4-(beta-D-ribofuranosyl)aminobenzene 5'-phosphate synthase